MSLFPQLQVTEVILQRSKLMATLQTVSGSDCIAGSVTVPLKWKPYPGLASRKPQTTPVTLCSSWHGGFLRLLENIESRSVSVHFHFQLHMALFFLYFQTHLCFTSTRQTCSPHSHALPGSVLLFCLLSPRASDRSQGDSVRHSMNTISQCLPTPLPSLLPQTEAFCFLFVHIYYLIY